MGITTSDEKSKFSKYNRTYICVPPAFPILGHHLWLSDAFAGGFSRLYFTFKDNHMQQATKRVTTLVKWRQISNFQHYYISNTGLARFHNLLLTPRLRTGRKDYYFIIVRGASGRILARFDIHRIVWDCFGNEPHKPGFEIHHIDLNPQNNHIDNLKLIPMPQHRRLHKEVRQSKNAD